MAEVLHETNTLREATHVTGLIATAVEEQSRTSKEIGESTGDAATGKSAVGENVAAVLKAVVTTDRTVADVARASKDVLDQAKRMEALIRSFIQKLAAS